HVFARNEPGEAVVARGRVRNRQAYRGRPRSDDRRAVREPAHLPGHHHLTSFDSQNNVLQPKGACSRLHISQLALGIRKIRINERRDGGDTGSATAPVASIPVRKALKLAREPLSMETPVGDEEGSHLGDFIEDKNTILPIDAAIQSNLRETTTR